MKKCKCGFDEYFGPVEVVENDERYLVFTCGYCYQDYRIKKKEPIYCSDEVNITDFDCTPQ